MQNYEIGLNKSEMFNTCKVAFLQNLNVAIVNGIPVKQHVVEAQLPWKM